MPHVKLSKDNQYLNLYYELHGHGETKILFIMGLLTEGAAWIRQTEFFAEKSDYQCVAYDNRGCGRSSAPLTFNYSTNQMAKDALALIDHLKWSKCHVVGISMGGMIALEFALMASDRILSLTLIATHAGGFAGRAPFVGVLHILRSFVLRDEKPLIENALTMLYSAKTLADMQKRQIFYDYHVERFRRRIPPALLGLIGQIFAVQRHFVSYADLLRIRYAHYPCLIFVGTEDRLVREQNSYLLQRTLGCRLIKLDDAGHGLQGERAKEINDELLHLFESIKHHQNVTKAHRPRDYQTEIAALDLCCKHRTYCLIHDIVGMIKGFCLSLLIYSFLSFLGATKLSLAHVHLTFNSVLFFACLCGLRRGLSCIFHAFRARRYVNEHRLQLTHASHHGGVGVALPEESKRGIPQGCGFEYPIPSLIFVVNLLALIYWIQTN